MSLDICVWDPVVSNALPSTYEEAGSLRDHLTTMKSEGNPRILQFAERLSALIQAMPEPDDELSGFYKNFVEESRHVTRAIYIMGLPPNSFMEAIRLIVQSARDSGLVVMYELPGTVFLPDGKMLPEGRLEMWQAAWQHMDEREEEEFPTTLKAFKAKVEPLLAAMAARYGFVKGKYPYSTDVDDLQKANGYIRDVSLGKQFFYSSYEGGRGEFRFYLNIHLLSDRYKSIADVLANRPWPSMLYISISNVSGFEGTFGGGEN